MTSLPKVISSPPPIISSRTNRYAIQQELSHKAGRRTFVAKDLSTHTPVILKLLQLSRAFSWEDLKLFKREGQILRQLSHPKIPQYQDSFETEIDGTRCFVLVQTYIPAPSLQTVVESGRLFTEAEVIAIAQQLLSVLSYLHQQLPPVIHRDLKPSNILISEPSPRATANLAGIIEREVYLVDFGAVQITASKSSGTVTIVGSYGYMPLEQFLGQTTPASDLYSLGMTLLYLLTGTHPAELPQTLLQIDGRIQIENLCDTIGLSSRFAHWLSQLIAPYPEGRFASAEEALTSLLCTHKGAGYFPELRPVNSGVAVERDRNKLLLIVPASSFTLPAAKIWAVLPKLCVFLMLLAWGLGFAEAFLSLMLIALFGGFSCLILLNLVLRIVLLVKHLFNPEKVDYRSQLSVKSYRLISIEKSVGEKSVGEKSLDSDRHTDTAIHQTVSIRTAVAKGISPHQLKSIRWHRAVLSNNSVRLLTFSPGHRFERVYALGGDEKVMAGINLPPKLSIHAGVKEFAITGEGVSAEDYLWLGKELSDFLSLPLRWLNATDEDTNKKYQQEAKQQQWKPVRGGKPAIPAQSITQSINHPS